MKTWKNREYVISEMGRLGFGKVLENEDTLGFHKPESKSTVFVEYIEHFNGYDLIEVVKDGNHHLMAKLFNNKSWEDALETLKGME